MKHLRMLALAAVAAAALMAFSGAGSASATTLTCEGSTCAVGVTFHLQSNGKTVIDAPFGNVECNWTVHGHITSVFPPRIQITSIVLTFCGSDNVVALATGTLEMSNIAGTKNGTVTSTGMEITVEHVGTHCIFKTNGTDIGTLTGTTTTGSTGQLDISATLPRVGGRSGVFCGSSAPWTGSATIDAPMTMDVDA